MSMKKTRAPTELLSRRWFEWNLTLKPNIWNRCWYSLCNQITDHSPSTGLCQAAHRALHKRVTVHLPITQQSQGYHNSWFTCESIMQGWYYCSASEKEEVAESGLQPQRPGPWLNLGSLLRSLLSGVARWSTASTPPCSLGEKTSGSCIALYKLGWFNIPYIPFCPHLTFLKVLVGVFGAKQQKETDGRISRGR